MRFPVKDSLTEDEVQAGLKTVIKDGLASQAMATLTGGAFLVAFALHLEASNLVIGILAAIPPLAQLIQIPSIYLVEKIRNRRAISVYGSMVSRFSWLFIAFIPFLFSKEAGLIFLIVAILTNSIFSAVSNCSWNSWMRDLVPQDRLGTLFSKRMMASTGIGIVLSLAAGFYIDFWKKPFAGHELYGYSILFFFGFLSGMFGVHFLSKTPEPRMEPLEKMPHFFKLIIEPFGDINFKNLVMFSGSWNFAVNLAAPFFTVYMLTKLRLEMSYIVALGVLSQIAFLVSLRNWGRLSDRFSNKSVLRVSGPIFMLCIFAWTFTTLPEKHVLTIPLLLVIHVFMGISTAGVNLASGNIGLKLSPKGQATSHLATKNLVNALTASIAPILGGELADFFAGHELSWTLKWTMPGRELTFHTLHFQHWDFFFFLACLIGFYSIHRLALVKEVGEVKEEVVVNELVSEARRDMRSLSTVGGLRQLVQFPFSILKYLKE
jgi:MFS family permease